MSRIAKKQYHFNFASELCMTVLFDQHPEERQLEKAEEIIGGCCGPNLLSTDYCLFGPSNLFLLISWEKEEV